LAAVLKGGSHRIENRFPESNTLSDPVDTGPGKPKSSLHHLLTRAKKNPHGAWPLRRLSVSGAPPLPGATSAKTSVARESAKPWETVPMRPPTGAAGNPRKT